MVIKSLFGLVKKLSSAGIVYLGYNIGKGLGAAIGGKIEDAGLDYEVARYFADLTPWITAYLTAKHLPKYIPLMKSKEFSLFSGAVETATAIGAAATAIAPIVNTPNLCDFINNILPDTYHVPTEIVGERLMDIGAVNDAVNPGSPLESMLTSGIDGDIPFRALPYVFSDSPNPENADLVGRVLIGAGLVGYMKNYFKGGLWKKISSSYQSLKKKLSFDKEHWKKYGKNLAIKTGALVSCAAIAGTAYLLGEVAVQGLVQYGDTLKEGLNKWCIDTLTGSAQVVRNLSAAGGFYLMSEGWKKWAPETYKENLGFLGTAAKYGVGIAIWYNLLKIAENVDLFGWKPYNPEGLVDWLGKERYGLPVIHEVVDWIGSGTLKGTINPINPQFWANIPYAIGKAINWMAYNTPVIGNAMTHMKEHWQWSMPVFKQISDVFVGAGEGGAQGLRLLIATAGYYILGAAKSGKLDEFKGLRDDISSMRDEFSAWKASRASKAP
jgi:hypothetical protein